MVVNVLKHEDEMGVKTSPKRCVGDNHKQLAQRDAFGVHNETSPYRHNELDQTTRHSSISHSRRIGRSRFNTKASILFIVGADASLLINIIVKDK